MYKELIHTMLLSGRAESKEGAFCRIFAQIKPTVAQELPGLIVRIEPLAVEIVSATAASYTERFLGLFFPRVRTTYEITAKVSVRLGIVEVEQIAFAEQAERLSPVQQLLRHG
ncbi:DUF4312 family protein [Brevibacillus marinus]|uniref:DUF4312 family protein n=1 Tax=Brevibacillus marinus TaxID=2496837 RepID=UPI000F834EA5|nr:DUF4312 family protein [Brevibacillus marinus]